MKIHELPNTIIITGDDSVQQRSAIEFIRRTFVTDLCEFVHQDALLETTRPVLNCDLMIYVRTADSKSNWMESYSQACDNVAGKTFLFDTTKSKPNIKQQLTDIL